MARLMYYNGAVYIAEVVERLAQGDIIVDVYRNAADYKLKCPAQYGVKLQADAALYCMSEELASLATH